MTTLRTTTLGGVLRHYRTKAGLSRERVGVQIERSTAAIRDWEQGAAEPRFSMLVGLAKIYGVPLAQLVAEVSGDDSDS